jgi:hypothetical protein
VKRLQQPRAASANHNETSISRQRNSRIGRGGEVGDIRESSLGENAPRLGWCPRMRFGLLRRRTLADIRYVGFEHLKVPARP